MEMKLLWGAVPLLHSAYSHFIKYPLERERNTRGEKSPCCMLISPLEVWQKRGEFVKGEKGDFLQPTQRGGENFTRKQKTAFLGCAFRGEGENRGEKEEEVTSLLPVRHCHPVHMVLAPHTASKLCHVSVLCDRWHIRGQWWDGA